MATLKELTWENHKRAERHAFVVAMMKNQLTKQQWASYLMWKRDLLIELVSKLDLTSIHPEFNRTNQFDADIVMTGADPRMLVSSQSYIEHVKELDDEQAWAHVYVHYLGDLKGGQILKGMVQLPMHHVDYDDVGQLEMLIRAHAHDGLAEEANHGFELTMAAMEEIMS